MAVMRDKNRKDVSYGDLIRINGKLMVLEKNDNIPMIEMMKAQGYLHKLESEIEFDSPHEEAKKQHPELYI